MHYGSEHDKINDECFFFTSHDNTNKYDEELTNNMQTSIEEIVGLKTEKNFYSARKNRKLIGKCDKLQKLIYINSLI